MRQNAYDMLYLTSCALRGTVPDGKRTAEMDLEKLFGLCQNHNLTAMVCMALESAGQEISSQWKEAKAKAIRKNILLDAERQNILRYMEQNGIWYMPLKGSVLKDLYPKLGMRQMADNDILFDAQYREQVQSFMESQGYFPKSVGVSISNHDVYYKEPVYNFELHVSLFGELHAKILRDYYRDVFPRLVKDTQNQFGYHFTAEDFYIYITAHTYKHYSGGGTGLRSLADTFVYTQVKGSQLDWAYVEAELEKLEMAAFEREFRLLSETVFSSDFDEKTLSEAERRMLENCLFHGCYGTVQNEIAGKVRRSGGKSLRSSKLRYLWGRVFPSMEFCRLHYPFFYRHKWLMPVLWVYRPVKGLLWNGKKLWKEFVVVKNMKD